MTAPLEIHVGEQFEKWTVIEVAGRRTKDGKQLVSCQCVCGATQEVRVRDLHRGKSKGCLSCRQPTRLRHGHMRVGHESLTHQTWRAMLDRCENPKSPSWQWYGAKGITICERWHSFESFLADMGERPGKDMTLDRKDPTLGYFHENCRWLSVVEQARHFSRNRLVTFQDKTHPLVTWSEITGIDANRIRHRLDHGWSVEDALTIPVRPHKPYRYRLLPHSGQM